MLQSLGIFPKKQNYLYFFFQFIPRFYLKLTILGKSQTNDISYLPFPQRINTIYSLSLEVGN